MLSRKVNFTINNTIARRNPIAENYILPNIFNPLVILSGQINLSRRRTKPVDYIDSLNCLNIFCCREALIGIFRSSIALQTTLRDSFNTSLNCAPATADSKECYKNMGHNIHFNIYDEFEFFGNKENRLEFEKDGSI